MAGGGPGAGYSIGIEPEVREWLQQCSLPEYRAVERAADRLAEEGELLPFPLSSHLGSGAGAAGRAGADHVLARTRAEGLCC